MDLDQGDAEVVEASLRNPDRFGELYDRYAGQLHRYAYRRVGPDHAEDVVADTFLAAFRRREQYDLARADARPWLFGIVSREISRHHRTEKARYRAVLRLGGNGGSADGRADEHADRVVAEVSAQATRAQLLRALRRLSAGDRDVLLLVAWADLSYEEVARALEIPIGTVRSRLNRARRKVRQALGGVDPTRLVEEQR